MSKFKTNDDVKLDYNVYGEGQPVIMVAGYSGNQATWAPEIDPFVASGLQVITYDRRNHGESDIVDYGMRISRHGQDLAELITFLGIEKPILVGHSMGASTIWAYESLYGDDNLRAVVTEDQIPKMLRDDSWPFGLFNADQHHFFEAIEALPRTKLTCAKISTDIKREIGKAYHPFDFSYNEPLLIDSLMQDWRDVVRREHIPHLFIAGSQSSLWSSDHAQAVAEMSSLGYSHIVSGAGHIPHIEMPDEFNQVVLEFISELIR